MARIEVALQVLFLLSAQLSANSRLGDSSTAGGRPRVVNRACVDFAGADVSPEEDF